MSDRIDRVVLFHDYSEALGGASYLVQLLLAELRARDIAVTFFAGDSGANFAGDDVEFIPLNGKSLLERSKFGAMTKGFFYPPSLHRVREWIARNDTPGTVYHVHGWTKILTPAIFGALQAISGRVILHGHDYFNACPNGAFFDYKAEEECSLKPLSLSCLGRQCDKSSYAHKLWRSGREGVRRAALSGMSNVNRMLLIHPGQAEKFLQAGWPQEKLVVVRNPVTPFTNKRVHAERNTGVVFIGRISREKGADLAARAAAQAGVPITFVGDGSEIDFVKTLNPKAEFLGRLDRSATAEVIAKARVAVIPSRWAEPFGLVALEAVGSGVPIIISDRALIAGEIVELGFGFSVDVRRIDLFSDLIINFHENNRLALSMSMVSWVNYSRICNDFDVWVDAILAVYEECL